VSLCFTGPAGSIEQRWIVYALLRDNVRHHLETGGGAPTFEAIRSAAGALGGGTVVLNARRLRAELERAREGLLGRPITDLAISLRTRSVIDLAWPPPDRDETTLVSTKVGKIGWLNPEARSLDEAFGHLIRGLLDITEGATEDDVVEVRDT